jgi:hypothetical protein
MGIQEDVIRADSTMDLTMSRKVSQKVKNFTKNLGNHRFIIEPTFVAVL